MDLSELHEFQPELHEFHFVLSKNMKKSLESLTVFEGLESLSGIIVRILTLLAPVIKREHHWGEEKMSQYMYVSPDPKEKREHVHTYLPGDLYRELKLIHHDLNFFSIAQIVRGFIEVFLELVEKHGERVLEELESMYQEWEKVAANNRLTLCYSLRQLWKIAQHITEGNRLITVYNEHFSPFWRFRL